MRRDREPADIAPTDAMSSLYATKVKRLVDLLIATTVLIGTLPGLAAGLVLSAVVCRADPLFRQERVGRDGRPFTILKIRTMIPADGASTVTVRDDVRVPRSLQWLRASKLDELPQLVNVLRGDMSLIGPRPTTPDDVARMTTHERRRHAVLPGITGLAQVRGNTALPWPRRIELDLEYVDRISFRLDCRISFETFVAVLRGSAGDLPVAPDEWSGGDRG